MTTNPQNDLVAIGVLCQQLQQTMQVVEAACLELNLVPALRINFVPHFDAQQVERIVARLREAENGKPLAARRLISHVGRHPLMPELRRPM